MWQQITPDNIEHALSVIPHSELLEVLLGIDENEDFDEDEHFFELGLARCHGLIKEDSLEITESGIQELKDIFLCKKKVDDEDEE